jgi:hypothetical protein
MLSLYQSLFSESLINTPPFLIMDITCIIGLRPVEWFGQYHDVFLGSFWCANFFLLE